MARDEIFAELIAARNEARGDRRDTLEDTGWLMTLVPAANQDELVDSLVARHEKALRPWHAGRIVGCVLTGVTHYGLTRPSQEIVGVGIVRKMAQRALQREADELLGLLPESAPAGGITRNERELWVNGIALPIRRRV